MTPWADKLVPAAGDDATDIFQEADRVKFDMVDNLTGREGESKVICG
jgi:hypothetical protein